ncbi:galactarate dehydratase, partial [Paracoccus sp. S4493]
MTQAPPTAIRLHDRDNIMVALIALAPGAPLDAGCAATEAIPAGHKVAIRPIAPGEPVLKYGQVIGIATRPIAAGAHVHVQNLGMGAHKQDHGFGSAAG